MGYQSVSNELAPLTENEAIGFLRQESGFSTKAIHAGYRPEQLLCRSIVAPIYMSASSCSQSNGVNDDLNKSENPTKMILEQTLAALDNAKYALVLPSGTAAQSCIIASLKADDGIICGHNIYTGTIELFRETAVDIGLKCIFVDMTKPEELRKALRSQKSTKVVWVETPSNPMMLISDIKTISDIVHCESNALVIVDNTPSSCYFQRPLDFGADVVSYSITKFVNGHNDVIMGSISTNNREFYEKIRFTQEITGITCSPFDCALVIRSLKTLSLRMERHSLNALLIARYLEQHPRVEKVLHPGLTSHPQHKIAISQSCGHGGSLCFYIKDGTLEQTKKFLKLLKVFTWADSLGGCESLAQAPLLWFVVPTSFSDEEVHELGLVENLIRLSCGLEDVAILIEDLNQALNAL
ncbi:hypothetical protein PVAND_003934 [Polypedilum vanderplanki]|uniref:cystathionine gamma-lyase n=1 Tax=Polypedilum vanderplanki TaxID=319348 RepID=A0A9J6BWP3_POLVA|nr:hypothetical protein PVAND_003934 [Polypedilum vanderplanki]